MDLDRLKKDIKSGGWFSDIYSLAGRNYRIYCLGGLFECFEITMEDMSEFVYEGKDILGYLKKHHIKKEMERLLECPIINSKDSNKGKVARKS